ncbi:uncharacterized protein TNCV_4982821 [Trichonephila clavipes]|uniref:RNase H type-1 domain-containing protein n=1 Tax=Trichonephila clavipes TaxID=2585209 RepID=A0A8X6WGS8_TRICX|nr:uncharacterized protein TNCV_4982821 [Trichonephila clavipes]
MLSVNDTLASVRIIGVNSPMIIKGATLKGRQAEIMQHKTFKFQSFCYGILHDTVVPFNIFQTGIRRVDNTGVAILEKLKHLSSFLEIHLQWVPSHVNITGNEIADSLAKVGAAQLSRTQLLSPIQNCTPPTSTTSHQLSLLLITNMRLNDMVVLFSFNAAGRNKLF